MKGIRRISFTLIFALLAANCQSPVQAAEVQESEVMRTEVEYEYFDIGTSMEMLNLLGTQESAVEMKDSREVQWIDRIKNLPEEVEEFYDDLVEATDNDGIADRLIEDTCFTSYLEIPVEVQTPVNSQEQFDSKVEQIVDKYDIYISAAYAAFDRDYPEVFWLDSNFCVGHSADYDFEEQKISVSFQFVIRDLEAGFDIRAEKYRNQDDLKKTIKVRDDAIDSIMDRTDGKNVYEKLKEYNSYLTKVNEYNTSSNLDSISDDCRNCISALEGKIGVDGPVCEGYARAFKVLCDKEEIPCVLVDGYAGIDGSFEPHMWNYVQIDNKWYAVDITWNDPVVLGIQGAVSGYESEEWFLVGEETVIQGETFISSHPVANCPMNNICFPNGPELCDEKYELHALPEPEPEPTPNPDPRPQVEFTDVNRNQFYYEPVQWAVEKNITKGVSTSEFAPENDCTRGQIVTFLWRAAGCPSSNEENAGFDDVEQSAYYYDAVLWAVENGITTGVGGNRFAPDATCTRGQVVTFLWRFANMEKAKNSNCPFDDVEQSAYYYNAVLWAVENGVTTGVSENSFAPDATCTRGQIVTFLYRAVN